MKLATLKSASRDGRLVVVSRDLATAVAAAPIAAHLQQVLEDWDATAPRLQALYAQLNAGNAAGAFAFDPRQAAAPLPRAYAWLDGSCFLNHTYLMGKAYNVDPKRHDVGHPLMYQGGSDDFLGPHDDVRLPSEADNIDFEGEVGIIVDDVPMGTSVEQAMRHIKLFTVINDISLRAHVMHELNIGFGWIHAKPSSSFAPVVVTADELGDAWRDGRVHLPLRIERNGEWFGHPNAGEMSFSFPELIEYPARTRNLKAGTIIGSGTISNRDRAAGSACIAERRAIEMIDQGAPKTSFLGFGERFRMEMRGADGAPLFGAIEQQVVKA